MLSNILANIKQMLINKNDYTDSTIEEIINFLKNYKKDMWIYPGVLKRKFNFSTVQSYSLLASLEEMGILDSYYELYCGHCQKTNGLIHKFNEIPEFFHCELCDEELEGLTNAILVYKVIRDE